MPVQMELSRIIISEINDQQVIYLKEVDGDRAFPILIGIFEATSIDRCVKGIPKPRPLTHDLLTSLVKTMGGTITHILVNDLSDDVFFARIVLDLNGQHLEVDSRPSDAIAVALRAAVPIYVEEKVLERASVGAEAAEATAESENRPAASTPERIVPAREEELKGLSAFKDFISTLDLDKLDKPGAS